MNGHHGSRTPIYRRVALLVAALALGVATKLAHPAEITHLTVSDDDGVYTVQMDARVSASPDRVFRILTDYDRLERLSPHIKEAYVIASTGEDVRRVYSRLKACVAFFCKTMRQVQNVRHEGTVVTAQTVPEKSSFHSGHARWAVSDVDGGARVTFGASLEPKFWVPPLIGPWMVRNVLRREAKATLVKLEALASEDR